MVAQGRVGAENFIVFLKRLVHNVPRTIFLIADGHPAHKTIKVARFVDSVKYRLRLFMLPSYSPELNPDERVWNHLKNNGIGRQFIHTKPQMKRTVISHMRHIQKSPDLICSFFQAETTQYAA